MYNMTILFWRYYSITLKRASLYTGLYTGIHKSASGITELVRGSQIDDGYKALFSVSMARLAVVKAQGRLQQGLKDQC